MILDPIQRRFGYGVARLAISPPAGSRSLSLLARTSAQREEIFAAMPTLLCIGFALLLALTVQLDSSGSFDPPLLASTVEDVRPPTQIELWIPTIPAPPKEFDQSTAVPEIHPVPANPIVPDQKHESGFDASSVAMGRIPSPPPNTYESDGTIERPRTSPRPSSRPSNLENDRPRLLASAFTPPKPATILSTDRVSTTTPDRPRRPGTQAAQDSAPFIANLSRSDNGREYLAARAADEAKGPQAPGPNRLPMVSAAGIAAANTMDRAVRSELGRVAYRSDWQEVPLDELPDCNPPGRQDLLKKRILLAAPFERECSHQDGSYRFIEARNLGAFLMLSRPNPDRSAKKPRALNVCDVLESALRCLDGSSIEESIQ